MIKKECNIFEAVKTKAKLQQCVNGVERRGSNKIIFASV
jgi:hypothetical protein